MQQILGQITSRLLGEFPAGSDGWTYRHVEESTTARAAAGYRLGSRWRTHFGALGRIHFATTGRPRRKRTPFWSALLNIAGPALALILLLGVTQAASLGYLR